MLNTKDKQKDYKATIAFWLITDNGKSYICPSLIAEKRINNIESIPIKNVWDGIVLTYETFSEDAVMTIIPEIFVISGVQEQIKNLNSILDIQLVREKIEELTKKYVKTYSK